MDLQETQRAGRWNFLGTERAGRWEEEVFGKMAVLEEVGHRMNGSWVLEWDLELWKKEAEREVELEGRIAERQRAGLGAGWGQRRRKPGRRLGKAAGQQVALHSRTEGEAEPHLQ